MTAEVDICVAGMDGAIRKGATISVQTSRGHPPFFIYGTTYYHPCVCVHLCVVAEEQCGDGVRVIDIERCECANDHA